MGRRIIQRDLNRAQAVRDWCFFANNTSFVPKRTTSANRAQAKKAAVKPVLNAERYNRRLRDVQALVEQVIDGDTLDLRIDTGFHIHTSGRFRLSGIDCPELPSKPALAARDFVYTQLLNANTIVVQTLTTDTHGRYLAHLFYTPDKTSIRTCFHEGHHLNEELLKEGHAQLVE